MNDLQTYNPELLPRRGELNAWLLAIASGLGLFFLSQRQTLPYWAWSLFVLLVLSAISISFGNWMDRKTSIQIDPDGIAYQNGLRRTHLTWGAIREVRTAPARWGVSVHVIGEKDHFSFSTLGEMKFQGQVRSRTGFAAGQQILDLVIRNAVLVNVVRNGEFLTYLR